MKNVIFSSLIEVLEIFRLLWYSNEITHNVRLLNLFKIIKEITWNFGSYKSPNTDHQTDHQTVWYTSPNWKNQWYINNEFINNEFINNEECVIQITKLKEVFMLPYSNGKVTWSISRSLKNLRFLI